MDIWEVNAVMSDIKMPGYRLNISPYYQRCYIYATYEEEDTCTGKIERQKTRDWLLGDMETLTESQIIQTALKCILTSAEHKVREHFLYKGKAIFGPHQNVDVLWNVTEEHDKGRMDK